MSRNFGEDRCMLCGGFMIFQDGEMICPNCNCTVSEVDYYEPPEDYYD